MLNLTYRRATTTVDSDTKVKAVTRTVGPKVRGIFPFTRSIWKRCMGDVEQQDTVPAKS